MIQKKTRIWMVSSTNDHSNKLAFILFDKKRFQGRIVGLVIYRFIKTRVFFFCYFSITIEMLYQQFII